MSDHSNAAPGRPELSLVICTLNEHEAIARVLAEAEAAMAAMAYEIVVVDDSDDDRTAAIVRGRAAADRRIRLVRRNGVRGLASACIAGWDVARGRLLAVMDGDGQHDATLLPALVAALRQDEADIAVASRFRPDTEIGLSGLRRILSRAGVSLSRAAIGSKTTDPLAGFFVLTRAWFEEVRPTLSGLGFKILVDVLASGLRAPRVAEVSTSLRARLGGRSKLDLRIGLELGAQLVEKTTGGMVPGRFVIFAAVGTTGIGVHLGVLGGLSGAAVPFWLAQAVAIMVAMTSNFTLNNLITFRDLRLRGRDWWSGLAGFVVACASGALVSEIVAVLLTNVQVGWVPAGSAGSVLAAAWNYWSSSRAAWGVAPRERDAASGVPVTARATSAAA